MGKEARIVRQVRGAMMYPMVMLTTAIGVTVFLLIFVLPRFATIYQSRGSALPLPTQILMSASEAVTGYWPLWVAGVVALVVGLIVALNTEGGKRGFDWLKLNVPVLRNMFRNLYVARASRTLGTMIGAGVSMLEAVAIVRGVTNNSYYRDLWDEVDEALQQGMQLSDPLLKSDLMPRSVTQMIRSGEHAGRLGHVLEKVAEFTELEFDESVKTTTQMIEPIMIGTMGGLVGFVAIALLLPIFSIGNVVSS
jgi:type IV pilus assembly protein PilC